MDVSFNDFIDRNNCLKGPTDKLATFFENHPTLYKVALVFNHLFRAAVMVGFMFIPGLPPLPAMGVCFAASLFYRLTVERNCAYKFALPAFAGSVAFMIAIPALIGFINGAALFSVSSALMASASFIPLALYGAYVLLTVNYDVNKNMKPKCDDCHCEVKPQVKAQSNDVVITVKG